MSSNARSISLSRARSDLLRIYAAAIAAVRPEKVVDEALAGAIDPAIPGSIENAAEIRVLAAGKAALGMALAVDRRLGSRVGESLVIAPATISVPAPQRFRVLSAAHPLPDESSEIAGRAALEFMTRCKAGELVLFLLSGGASALMAVPAAGISLAEKITVTAALMRTGASIAELNTVRKHLSAIKGGGLIRGLRPDAQIVSLILSDVPGNDPATIGSGPAAADPSTFIDAIAVLKRRKLWGRTPEAVRERLERGAAGEIPDTLKSDAAELSRCIASVIADNGVALEAAANAARAAGYEIRRWRDLSGPADLICRELAEYLGGINDPRVCVIAGGEPSVMVKGPGRGGRAQHCALALAIECAKRAATPELCAMFAGTDGIDGPTDAAGAIVTDTTLQRAREAKVDPQAAIDQNNSYAFFQALGDLLVTGPTGTNVTDIFVALVNPRN